MYGYLICQMLWEYFHLYVLYFIRKQLNFKQQVRHKDLVKISKYLKKMLRMKQGMANNCRI